MCDQVCENTKGSHKCHCKPGYEHSYGHCRLRGKLTTFINGSLILILILISHDVDLIPPYSRSPTPYPVLIWQRVMADNDLKFDNHQICFCMRQGGVSQGMTLKRRCLNEFTCVETVPGDMPLFTNQNVFMFSFFLRTCSIRVGCHQQQVHVLVNGQI